MRSRSRRRVSAVARRVGVAAAPWMKTESPLRSDRIDSSGLTVRCRTDSQNLDEAISHLRHWPGPGLRIACHRLTIFCRRAANSPLHWGGIAWVGWRTEADRRPRFEGPQDLRCLRQRV